MDCACGPVVLDWCSGLAAASGHEKRVTVGVLNLGPSFQAAFAKLGENDVWVYGSNLIIINLVINRT